MGLQRITIAPEQFHRDHLTLTVEQAHYLRQVLRLRSGDQFLALSPQGGLWRSALTEESHLATVLAPYSDFPELWLQTTLLVALPKTGFDEVVRQSVELGVKAIVPVLSERSLLQPSEQKQKRWQRIAQEAAEQCERNCVPTLSPPLPLATALALIPSGQARYIGVTRRSAPTLLQVLSALTSDRDESPVNLAIVTGPEGGWTEAEVEQAVAQGYQPISLGPLILRAVTAPIAAMSVVMAMG